jgi:type IV pilus assembly protein PilB
MNINSQQRKRNNKVRLGDILVSKNIITREQLQKALQYQAETGDYLGETLMKLNLVSPEQLYGVLAEQLQIPFVKLDSIDVKPDVLQLVPEKFARRFFVLPLSVEDKTLRLAVSDHLDIVALDTLESNTGYTIQPVLADRGDLKDAIDRQYGRLVDIEQSLQDLLDEEEGTSEEGEEQLSVEELEAEASNAPVVRFVNLLIHQAIEKRASDLHIEPRKKSVDVRARIDGVLHKLTPPTKAMFPAVVSRIKILSGLDIGERRLPQDGRCKVEDQRIDIRVSTLPTIYGEKIVMRLLDKRQLVRDMSELGFEPAQLKVFESKLEAPQGIILVTGPTGSGKTTTLYSGLSYVRSDAKNIVTVEDPVEYEIEGINQVQTKPAIGLDFAGSLRSILRQDPDVIMVGEIRDLETAQIAVRAALTGHLVLSTLHTNNAVATVNRLIDMGVKPYLVGPCLELIVAQRLVRRICEHCREIYNPPRALLDSLGLPSGNTYYHGAGCSKCMHTGYQGRVAIFEILSLDEDFKRNIARGISEDELKKAGRAKGMAGLRESGINKVKEGVTTPEEIAARTLE